MAAHRVLHLSDLHLTASGLDEDGVDAAAALDGLLHDLRFVTGIDAVVVSGDIADDGSPAGYSAALQRIAPFAALHRARLVWTTGNHDDRAAFVEVLGSGHHAESGADIGSRFGDGRVSAVSAVDGLRIITVDSLIPGERHGRLGDEQLAWLRDLLAYPAPAGTVLVVHHPPVDMPGRPRRDVRLDDVDAFTEAIAGSDVRAVLAGHLHHQLAGTLRGVPVWVTPGVVSRIDLTAPAHLVRAVRGASASVIDLDVTGGATFHVLHARDPVEPIYLYDTVTGADAATEERT